jgi:Uncharacterized protein conserved in bacteria
MEKILVQTLLYDFYGELLTAHQKSIFEEVVLNDYSLSEIAEEKGISRQGVHDIVKRCNQTLKGYEEKLQLVEKFLNTKQKVKEINLFAQNLDNVKEAEVLQKIEKLSKEILEEL